MTKGIVLITPPAYKRTFRDQRMQPHIGLAMIARYVLEHGIECEIIDGYTFSLSIPELVAQTIAANPILVGVTTSTMDRFSAIDLIRALKTAMPDVMIVGGGQHFTYSAVNALESIPELDFVCRGEGEILTVRLYEALEGGGDLSGIAGLVYRNGDEIVKNFRQREYADFNSLVPAWELFDLTRYNGKLTMTNHTRAMGVISSRGCNNHCVYCANALNRFVRYKDPVFFGDEVEMLVRENGFEGLNIQDDSFTSSLEHVSGICEEFMRRDLNILWYCSLRLDEATRPMLEIMKKAGCVGLGFGVESGSESILKNIRKGTNVGMIKNVLAMVKDLGFPHVGMFAITSLPGETPETFMQSQNVLNEIYGKFHEGWERQPVLGSLAQIYPGTPLEILGKRNGSIPKNFSWNTYYENPKFNVFEVSRYVPHFEEQNFPIENIKEIVTSKFPGRKLYIC